jgi:hypothetical protein
LLTFEFFNRQNLNSNPTFRYKYFQIPQRTKSHFKSNFSVTNIFKISTAKLDSNQTFLSLHKIFSNIEKSFSFPKISNLFFFSHYELACVCVCLVGGWPRGAETTLVFSHNFQNLHFLKSREVRKKKNEEVCSAFEWAAKGEDDDGWARKGSKSARLS